MNDLLNILLADSPNSMTLLIVLIVILAFIVVWIVNRISILRIRKNTSQANNTSDIMKHTLDLGHSCVIRLDQTLKYAYNIHGNFLPDNGMDYEESFARIHPDDWPAYKTFMKHLVLDSMPTDKCVFRWNVSRNKDVVEWRYFNDQGVAEYANGRHARPTNLFCTLNDVTEQVERERREQEMTDKYRRIFEQSIVGLAFTDKEGKLLNVNQRLREILKFQSDNDPFYYSNTIYDMPPFRDMLLNRQIEELNFCAKSIIPERGVNCFMEIHLHPICDDNGHLIYISLSVRDITQERELYMLNRKNEKETRLINQEMQEYETELFYLLDNCDMRFWRSSFKDGIITFYKGLNIIDKQFTFKETASFFDDLHGNIDELFSNLGKYFTKPGVYLCHMKDIFGEGGDMRWNIIDLVPDYDENHIQKGCFGIIRNVTDLIQKQEQLKKETQRANDSGHMKSVFMANMTHEIRTPLNSIVGFSELLPMIDSSEEKKQMVHVIMDNCDMLLRLINDILEISTMGDNTITLEPEHCDFSKAFDTICQSLEKRVENPAVKFLKDNPCDTLTAFIDQRRLKQVLTNFVTNAVKYTKQGHIRVGYELVDDGLRIYCEDTGIGIPKDKQDSVFDRFVKLNDFVQGTGLGLSICKAIADRVGGQIGVDSEGEGKGSTFWMWAPMSKITDNADGTPTHSSH